MRTLTALSILALGSLSGCIYYEGSGCGDDGCWEDTDYGCWEDDCDDTCTQGDGEETDPFADPYALYMTPNHVEQGSQFIASIRTWEWAPFTDVRAVELDGDAEVQGLDTRGREVVLFVSVAPDAEVGPMDVYVTFEEGTYRLNEPLVVFEAGSGHEPGSSDDGSLDECW